MDHYERKRAALARRNDPATADNMDVRKALLDKVKAGGMTFAECQAELKRIQLKARREGKPTAYGTQSWVKET